MNKPFLVWRCRSCRAEYREELSPMAEVGVKSIGVEELIKSSLMNGLRFAARKNVGSWKSSPFLGFPVRPIALRNPSRATILVPSSKTAQRIVMSPILRSPLCVALSVFFSVVIWRYLICNPNQKIEVFWNRGSDER